MARVAGIDLPKNKRLDIALRYIYGIGPVFSDAIIEELNLDPAKRVKDLTEAEINQINNLLTKKYKIEGDLRREVQANIKRLVDIGSYKGMRHKRNLPVRGQRSKTNARTRRGKRKTVGAGAGKAAQAKGAKKK